MKEEIKLEKRKPAFDYILNDLAFDSLMFKIVNGIGTSQDRCDFDYQIKLMQKEISKLRKIRYEARKMIFDNYGVLDKYQIDMLDEILKGGE